MARIPAAQFRKLAAANRAISDLCIRYNETLLSQARITRGLQHLARRRGPLLPLAAAKPRPRRERHHPLTQEFLSEMLGVRRTSVTEVAVKLQDAGVIDYSRGIIKIADRAKLEATSCECYETLRQQTPFPN